MQKQQAIVSWIIWFAILQGAFIIHFVIGGGFPSGDNVEEPMAAFLWVLCFVPIAIATIIRWIMIPKLEEPQKKLVAMIAGLALSESPIFFSLFLIGSDYPQNQIAVLIVAVLSLIQLAPSYLTAGYEKG